MKWLVVPKGLGVKFISCLYELFMYNTCHYDKEIKYDKCYFLARVCDLFLLMQGRTRV